MNIINPSFEIWYQEPGLLGMYKQIERAGRVCYKSENNATADSAQPFVERMMKSKHTAMLEHGTVYLKGEGLEKYTANKFSHYKHVDGTDYVTTNLRVLEENGWMDDLQLFCEPTAHHDLRITVHFTTQIAITREFNRHRANSMAEQSTRYCNYSKDKFSGEISINLPTWISELEDKVASTTDFVALSTKVAQGTASEYENWLFANTPGGAQASSVIYSLIETAKENGLDPYRYLLWVLRNAPVLSQSDEPWAEQLSPANAPDECRIPLK